MTVAPMGVRRALVMLAAVAALNLFAEGEPKMPTLNWMGRGKATKSVKEVVMKILRKSCRLHYFERAYGCESSKVKLTGKKARC